MKHSGTAIILVIVWAAVLLAAYGIGLCIREVRFRHVEIESKMAVEPQMEPQIQKPSGTTEFAREPAEMVQAPPDIRPMPDGEDREDFPAFPPEKSGKLKKDKGKTEEKQKKMSGEDKKELKAQMREIFGEKQKEAKKISPNVSDEERARLKQQWKEVKKTRENMPEQEKEQFKGKRRERFDDRRPLGERGQ